MMSRSTALNKTRWLRSCADDPKKASAKLGRCFRRLHAHGLIAKIPRTRRWRVTAYGHQAMGCVAVSARAPLPQRLRHSSSGLIFFAKDKELTAKESTRAHTAGRSHSSAASGPGCGHDAGSGAAATLQWPSRTACAASPASTV